MLVPLTINYGIHTSASSSRGGTILGSSANDAYQWRI